MKYDVIIIGAGPVGVFASYELSRRCPKAKMLLIDKGMDIYSRSCPALEGKISQCPKDGQGRSGCQPSCSITGGFGGAGAFSDGKYNITTEFGGWLTDYMPSAHVLDLIRYVDNINLAHGADSHITDPSTEIVRNIEQKAYSVGLKLLRSEVRHLGTERNLQILKSIREHLGDKVDMLFSSEVEDILTQETAQGKKVAGVLLKNGKSYESGIVIAAPGRDGSAWLSHVLQKNRIKMFNNQVDVGVRVETSDIVMREINENLDEGKFVFNTSVGTKVRTFCSNPSGHVVVENHSGIMAANGHAYKQASLRSRNTNFALLVSHTFTEPFDKPNEYAREICRRANDLTSGGIMVQRFSDILNGRRSTTKRIEECFIEPTLKEAIPGDLGLALPYTTMKSLIEMMAALDRVTPGIASEHTLFYGIEAKFYSARPYLSRRLESEIEGLFCGGDGAGVTRGLAQAGAAGVHIARQIAAL